MKKSKILLPLLAIASAICLSSCSLFYDYDIVVENHFSTPQTEEEIDPNAKTAGGSKAKTDSRVPDVTVYKSICYAKENTIVNTYKEGGINYNGYNVNGGEDYYGDKSSNNYDLYVPDNIAKDQKHMVVLFIHGGAWVSGFKTDVNPYVFELANEGYITATIKYTLLKRSMDDPSLSIFRNLDEIDACITSIKEVLEELEFDTSLSNLAIGGASSGAHLAMLYSYSRGYKAVNGSAIPLRFIIDAVGPVNIQPECWKAFKFDDETEESTYLADEDALTYSSVNAREAAGKTKNLPIAGDSENSWNDYQTMRIANGMCGLPYSLEMVEASSTDKANIDQPNEASNSMTVRGTREYNGEELLSVGYWLNKLDGKLPIICAYAGKDTIVGINQFATLQSIMETKGYVRGTDYEYVYFPNGGHSDISKEKDETKYNAFVNYVKDWCVSKNV